MSSSSRTGGGTTMARTVRRRTVRHVAVVLAGCGGLAVVVGAAPPSGRRHAPATAIRWLRPFAVPRVFALRTGCDDARRFTTVLHVSDRGASLRVRAVNAGRRVIDGQVNPGASVMLPPHRGAISAWTVVLRHAPETVTYHLRLDERTTAVDSLCYVASLAVSIKTVPNSP